MLPGGIHDVVCQSVGAGSICQTYQGMRDKVQNLVSRAVSLWRTGPGCMDVGSVGGDCEGVEVKEYLAAACEGLLGVLRLWEPTVLQDTLQQRPTV